MFLKGVETRMVSATPAAAAADERAALTAYLRVSGKDESPRPLLDAAMRDARETMAHGKALWLATLGYLIIVEVVGGAVARPSTAFPDRGGAGKRFQAGAREFAPSTMTRQDAEALYGLRCALAHEYGLHSKKGQKRHIFTLTQTGTLVVHPPTPWTPGTNPTPQVVTTVNVRAVGDFVEKLVAEVRLQHQAANVTLAPGITSMDLRNYGQMLIY
jgi:hypothetical protein